MIHEVSEEGLTTTKAPFIENAVSRNQLFIHQPYELYSNENQTTWTSLYNEILPMWEKYANERFLKGVETLHLTPNKIPKLKDINKFLEPITGFQAKPVSGYVPGYLFFDCLHKREFPTTITIRELASKDYLPEPDIFHDIAGHVPMHTDPVFADVLVKFGSLAKVAADRCQNSMHRIQSCIKALSRFFWFTVEFGIMKEKSRLCVYGSGLLSSVGEIVHCVESPNVQRFPFQLEWVINQSFEIDKYQPLLFIIDSFDHLFEEVNRLEKWLIEGKLDNVAPGDPTTDQDSLDIFLNRNKE
ncbi:MAG: phenylalanine 4-monooxygenase [Chlamydiota bacterium]|nr:phenylalanine 4-monooxygenase [Chlamydiota bacterium]